MRKIRSIAAALLMIGLSAAVGRLAAQEATPVLRPAPYGTGRSALECGSGLFRQSREAAAFALEARRTAAPQGGTAPQGTGGAVGSSANRTHKFWDKESVALFAGVAAVRALDFTSTQHFRERRVNEALLTNSIVDNKPLFAGIELAGAAASVAVSYWLHHKGHHRAERWVSIVHIGIATFGDSRNYGLSNVQGAGAR